MDAIRIEEMVNFYDYTTPAPPTSVMRWRWRLKSLLRVELTTDWFALASPPKRLMLPNVLR